MATTKRKSKAAAKGSGRQLAGVPLEYLVEIERRVCMLQTDSKIKNDLALLWNKPPVVISNWLKLVRGAWEHAEAINRPRRRAFMRSAMEHGIARCYALDDMRAAAVLFDRLCRLDGLYEQPDSGSGGSSTDGQSSIDVGNPDAVRKRIAELHERIEKHRASRALTAGAP